MKKFLTICFNSILITALVGCAKGSISCPPEPANGAEVSADNSAQNIISSDMLGQGFYDALAADWSAWNAKDEWQKVISSHLPGACYKQFDTWAECEEFLGFPVWNPLEDSKFEKASYVGTPVDREVPRFYVNFYGPNGEQVDWISVESGYRDGDIRITVNAKILVDTPKDARDGREPVITEDSGESYVAREASVEQGAITYRIRVIGEKNAWDAVRATMEKVLPYFEETENNEGKFEI